ncbi:hypothetical protein [Nostoc linckia]|nr:hypothetical protein [Nostoc linckia]
MLKATFDIIHSLIACSASVILSLGMGHWALGIGHWALGVRS